MKKITAPLLAALLLFTTACSGGTSTSSPPETPPPSASASVTAQTYTGILEQINDDMILVTSEVDDSKVYTFGTEDITVDASLGSKVTVTYTGDLDDVDSLLEASKVEAVNSPQ